jgi:hypothetical protein
MNSVVPISMTETPASFWKWGTCSDMIFTLKVSLAMRRREAMQVPSQGFPQLHVSHAACPATNKRSEIGPHHSHQDERFLVRDLRLR